MSGASDATNEGLENVTLPGGLRPPSSATGAMDLIEPASYCLRVFAERDEGRSYERAAAAGAAGAVNDHSVVVAKRPDDLGDDLADRCQFIIRMSRRFSDDQILQVDRHAQQG
jgi:hypothetical protein